MTKDDRETLRQMFPTTAELDELLADSERLEQVREKLPQMMKAVCAGCNNGVRMNSYNKHENGMDCEAVRYRDVLDILKGEWRG